MATWVGFSPTRLRGLARPQLMDDTLLGVVAFTLEMYVRINSEINESVRCESDRSRRCRRTPLVPR
jgi:hypothetical protein